ncbi:hypothetical protein B7463_g3047, partial [Scytalidium lignicola]
MRNNLLSIEQGESIAMAPSAVSPTNGTQPNGDAFNHIDFTTFKNIINGELKTTKAKRHGINPATKEPNWEVPIATKQDVDNAVQAAQNAFTAWSATSIQERREALDHFADALMEYKDDFSKLLTTEQGKPIHLARGEVDDGFTWLKEISKLTVPEEVVIDNDERQVITRYTPLGVVVGIVPWNFPIQLACGKIAPAIMTGNTIIIKPSPFTPYCDLKIAELAQRFFPPGVIQALSGDDDLGPMLTSHPGVNKISFTGSTATGKKVMESASQTLKRVTLELGGNDPAIICGDVNIATVAPEIARLAFLNSGQICLALKRIYVHESIYPEFRDTIVEMTKKMKAGDGFEDGVFLGPVQNKMQYDRVKMFFDDIEKEGQKIAVGGISNNSSGYFITPTIIDDPKEDSKIVTEEQFGPIVPLLSWSTEDEVVTRANHTKMGLGASVWSSDLTTARRIARRLEAGNVWVNSHLEVTPLAAFGGHKESGIGMVPLNATII